MAEVSRSSEVSHNSRLSGTGHLNNTQDNRLSNYEERPAMLSPKASHKDYNRYKYYSALRTGYKHLAPDETDTFLNPPVHVIDSNLFKLHNPFGDIGKCSSSFIIKARLAIKKLRRWWLSSAVGRLWWAAQLFQCRGPSSKVESRWAWSFVLQVFWFHSTPASSSLIWLEMIPTTQILPGSIMVRKILANCTGKTGYYIGLIAPALLIVGAIIVYFVIMC